MTTRNLIKQVDGSMGWEEMGNWMCRKVERRASS